MNMRIYYNVRTGTFYKYNDKNIPDGSIEYRLGDLPDVITEHYVLPNGDALNYAYSNSIRKYMTKETEEYHRLSFLKSYVNDKYNELTLKYITIPMEAFLEYCKIAGFDGYAEEILLNGGVKV